MHPGMRPHDAAAYTLTHAGRQLRIGPFVFWLAPCSPMSSAMGFLHLMVSRILLHRSMSLHSSGCFFRVLRVGTRRRHTERKCDEYP